MTGGGGPSLGYFILSRVVLGVLFKLASALVSSGISLLRGLPVERVWGDIGIGLFVLAVFGAALGGWEYSTGRNLFPALPGTPSSRA